MDSTNNQLSFLKAIRVPLFLIFIVSLFNFPKPNLDELMVNRDIEIVEGPTLKKRRKHGRWIELKIKNDDRVLFLGYHNYRQANINKITNLIEKGTNVTLGLRGKEIYYIELKDEELTNLKLANAARRQVQLWGLIFSFVAIFLSFTPERKLNDLKSNSRLYIVFVLIATVFILGYWLGVEHLF